jgi:alanine racemase
MTAEPQHETWVEVDLSAVENNVRQAARGTSARIMAVLKANGYGHGAAPVALAALRAGASWCGVARLDEALELRRAGVESSILVLSPVANGRLERAVAEDISLTVFTHDQVQQAAAEGRAMGRTARLHLKVDTGMARLGVDPREAVDLARVIAAESGARLEAVSTHFARADEPKVPTTDRQLETFRAVLEAMRSARLLPDLVHAANSAAALTRPDAHFDMVRLGVAIYGLDPSSDCRLPEEYRPALSWKARLIQVRRLPAGRGVSYGHEYQTRSEERVGTALVGYADGFRRVPGNLALLAGRRVPVIGRVCMDMCVLQLDAVSSARAGDEVVLVGEQGGERIRAEEVAMRWGTINYEVTCGIGARVPRVYR